MLWQGLTGWPKLHFQVWCQDQHGRTDLCECARRPAQRLLRCAASGGPTRAPTRTPMTASGWGGCTAQAATGSATCPPPRVCTSWSASRGARREQPRSSSPVRTPVRTPGFRLGSACRCPPRHLSELGGGWSSVAAYFIGGAPRLKLEEVVHSPADRFRLQVRWNQPPPACCRVLRHDARLTRILAGSCRRRREASSTWSSAWCSRTSPSSTCATTERVPPVRNHVRAVGKGS